MNGKQSRRRASQRMTNKAEIEAMYIGLAAAAEYLTYAVDRIQADMDEIREYARAIDKDDPLCKFKHDVCTAEWLQLSQELTETRQLMWRKYSHVKSFKQKYLPELVDIEKVRTIVVT